MPDYNISLLKESETIFELVQFADNAANNILFPILILGVGFILILTLVNRFGFIKSMVTAGFVNFLLALMMNSVGLINDLYVYGFLTIWAAGLFILLVQQNKD